MKARAQTPLRLTGLSFLPYILDASQIKAAGSRAHKKNAPPLSLLPNAGKL